MFSNKHLTINHHTYLEGPTYRGNVACVKRLYEIVKAKIKLPMSRFTNPYNPAPKSEVFPYIHYDIMEREVPDYVVSGTLDQSKLAAISYRITGGSSKGNTQQKDVEFGISRNMKVWGKRRFHSTAFICGKETSCVSEGKDWFSGESFESQLINLTKQSNSKYKVQNLTTIMSDPNFLVACWIKIKSKKGNMIKSLDHQTLDGINESWFQTVAKQFGNGKFKFKPSRRKYISKPNGKRRSLTIPSPRDKIVQEAMRTLLDLVFENRFRDSSHAFRVNRGCHTCLKEIRYKFAKVNWFIEGDIEQQYPSIDHQILIELIRKEVDDEPFIDLLYKYLRVGYGESNQNITFMQKGLIQGGSLSPILSNIFMHEFDVWMEDVVIPKYNKGKRKKSNPEFRKMLYDHGKAVDKSIRTTIAKDSNYCRVYYVRYVDDFLIGVNGNKAICNEIKTEILQFLKIYLLSLSLEKTHITHSTKSKASFLGYEIKCTPIGKMQIGKNLDGILTRRTTNAQLMAPIKEVLTKLKQKGFSKGENVPTRNGKYINFPLTNILEEHKTIEKGILNYYGLANNYGRLAARVHYILKYSCALTISSKMKLRTLRGAFRKYGKNLAVFNDRGKMVDYPAPSYKRPKVSGSIKVSYNAESLIEKLSVRHKRHSSMIKGPCIVCGATNTVEIHHIRALKEIKDKKDWLSKTMSQYSRKQVPVCKKCHINIHLGIYDGNKL
jgi:group II intron reverse transcriptase/maturase